MEHVRWFDSSLEGREHRVARRYALAMGGLGSMAFTASEWLTMTPVKALIVAVALMLAGGFVGTEYRLMYRLIRKSMSFTKLLCLLLPSAPFVLAGTLSLGVATGLADWDTLSGLPKALVHAYIPFA
ncbi:hypothetical protein IAE39_000122 [Pseudomonas sp. S37]|uniref:hypothetical protein n=1 Tax=unclassified Pseudomonas TaxID=196821 RepID=UPI001913A680|nr:MULTISPECIES: hypothetical protein [unclassified Pseudomonas]MBK4987605.1 hypothetical protein [Pseudomonas sp. S36]MBK4991948.1 hypothetical protein [Pseudomonas sp. S37]